jgi:16S rRNA (adenine1518-N6/adenine1519-N6)-dimethyltransferase|tara:strand:+ start:3900 stop:4709 length:810 start_codon:yes stop_codon:yes gene_type:complete
MNGTNIKKLLQEYQIRPNKRLGQNFLIDENILNKIVKTADISKTDTVIEIGAGLGNLTQVLAQKAKQVIAIEKDKRLIRILNNNLKNYKNVKIVQGDILNTKYEIRNTKYKLVANLPYYITSPLIRKFLELKNPPQDMTLLVQKEVAQRICAQPPKMNLLTVAVQFYSRPKIANHVSKEHFWPKPKVDSAILRIKNIEKPKVDVEKFFKLVKAGFSSPRKQLINNLSRGLDIDKKQIKRALIKCELDSQTRAQNLRVNDWLTLVSSILF